MIASGEIDSQDEKALAYLLGLDESSADSFSLMKRLSGNARGEIFLAFADQDGRHKKINLSRMPMKARYEIESRALSVICL